MKQLLIYLCALFFIGCDNGYSTDPEFEPIIKSFIADHQQYKGELITVSASVVFDTTSHLAEYHLMSDGSKVIKVNKSKWVHMLDAEKKALIYHELGHSELGYIEHRDEVLTIENGYDLKMSIMNKSSRSTLRDDNIRDVNDFYMYEFFNNDQSVWEEFK